MFIINRAKFVLLVIMLASIVVNFSACVSFKPSTALIIKDVEVADRLGAKAKIYIAVTGMPNGGIATIQVNVGGFSWDPNMIKILDIKGLNGFTVLAKSFDNTKGTGGFGATNPTNGVQSGNILELIVKRVIPSNVTSTGLEIAKSVLFMADAANNWITTYTLVNGEARLKGR